MDNPPLCPEWWPKLNWDLHFGKFPWPPGPGPVNLPIEMDNIFKQLSAHTMTYTMRDQKLAQVMRTQLEGSLGNSIKNLSAMHDASIAGK